VGFCTRWTGPARKTIGPFTARRGTARARTPTIGLGAARCKFGPRACRCSGGIQPGPLERYLREVFGGRGMTGLCNVFSSRCDRTSPGGGGTWIAGQTRAPGDRRGRHRPAMRMIGVNTGACLVLTARRGSSLLIPNRGARQQRPGSSMATAARPEKPRSGQGRRRRAARLGLHDCHETLHQEVQPSLVFGPEPMAQPDHVSHRDRQRREMLTARDAAAERSMGCRPRRSFCRGASSAATVRRPRIRAASP